MSTTISISISNINTTYTDTLLCCNHAGFPANVCYHEINLPGDLPLALHKFIPNVYFRSLNYEDDKDSR